MRRVAEVPEAVQALYGSGVVLEFVFFADVDDTEAEARTAVGMAVEHVCTGWPAGSDGTPRGVVHRAHLHRLPCRVLTQDTFLGDWMEPGSGTRLRGRDYTGLVAPGVFSSIELWSGGQFAYAFANPPYSLRVDAGRTQELFDAVCDLVLPTGNTCVIRDWSGEELLALCPDYFEPGTEWWGVFLFTIHLVKERRLTVIMASQTD